MGEEQDHKEHYSKDVEGEGGDIAISCCQRCGSSSDLTVGIPVNDNACISGPIGIGPVWIDVSGANHFEDRAVQRKCKW